MGNRDKLKGDVMDFANIINYLKSFFQEESGKLSSTRIISTLIVDIFLFNWIYLIITTKVPVSLDVQDLMLLLGALGIKSFMKNKEFFPVENNHNYGKMTLLADESGKGSNLKFLIFHIIFAFLFNYTYLTIVLGRPIEFKIEDLGMIFGLLGVKGYAKIVSKKLEKGEKK